MSSDIDASPPTVAPPPNVRTATRVATLDGSTHGFLLMHVALDSGHRSSMAGELWIAMRPPFLCGSEETEGEVDNELGHSGWEMVFICIGSTLAVGSDPTTCNDAQLVACTKILLRKPCLRPSPCRFVRLMIQSRSHQLITHLSVANLPLSTS